MPKINPRQKDASIAKRMQNLQRPQKGERNPGSGRPKGRPNFFTREIKEALIAAANNGGDVVCKRVYTKEQLERNPGLATLKNYGGLEGYLTHLSIVNNTAFAALLGKVLPIQLVSREEEERIVPYKSVEEVREELRKNGLLVDLKPSEYAALPAKGDKR